MELNVPALFRKRSVLSKKKQQLLGIQISIWNERNRIIFQNNSFIDDDTYISRNATPKFNELYDLAYQLCDEIMNLESVDKSEANL